jgi:plastocyanin
MNKNKIAMTALLAIALFLLACPLTPSVRAAMPDQTGSVVAGTVKFLGTPPKGLRIDMSADPNCAKAHPAPVTTQDIEVTAAGEIENVVVYVADGLGEKTFPAPSQAVVLEQKGCTYRPHVVALQANQKLDVVNADTTTHNIHPMPLNNREWNKTQPPGMPVEESFAREEIAIPVKCNVHPWMKGYIAIFKHPYFAVTDKSGNFTLKDLPPGTYTIKAWHEKLGTRSQAVTVAAGQSGKVDFIFKQ